MNTLCDARACVRICERFSYIIQSVQSECGRTQLYDGYQTACL